MHKIKKIIDHHHNINRRIPHGSVLKNLAYISPSLREKGFLIPGLFVIGNLNTEVLVARLYSPI